MRSNIACLVLLLGLSVTTEAQDITGKKKPAVYLMPQIGLLNGDHAVGAQVQLTGGLVSNQWMYGLGTGIDYYRLRSVPVFADVRRYLNKMKSTFLYTHLGYHFSWVEQDHKTGIASWNTDYNMRGGLYLDAGIGHDMRIKKTKALTISIGYTQKQMRESYTEQIWILPVIGGNSFELSPRTFDYTFRRLLLKVAYRLK